MEIVLFLFVIVLILNVLHPKKEKNDSDFEIQDDKLIQYHGLGRDVVIPEDVTSIGSSAFMRCENLTEINIPKGVTEIKFMTFYKCLSLKSVTLPEGITSIENSAFDGCTSLTSLTIPESVTNIGKAAFFCCENLTEINIPKGVTEIKSMTFYKCSGLRSVTLPEGITSIGNSAFDGCISLTSLTIPEGVTSIGRMAFLCCENLTELIIPESVSSIGDDAFYECVSLKHVRFGNVSLNPDDGVSIYDKVNLIHDRDYSVQMKSEVKYDIMAQMYMLDMDTDRIHDFIRYRRTRIINIIIDKNYGKAIDKILASGDIVTKDNIDDFILYAIENQKYDIQLMLMDYKTNRNWYDDTETIIKRKFDL